MTRPLWDARASREAISLRTLLRAQSLRGHNGTAGPPPNLCWTLSVASGMLGLRWLSSRLIRCPLLDGRRERPEASGLRGRARPAGTRPRVASRSRGGPILGRGVGCGARDRLCRGPPMVVPRKVDLNLSTKSLRMPSAVMPDRTYLFFQSEKGFHMRPRVCGPMSKAKFVMRCADCGCSPDECREAPSAIDCPACKLDECCCWNAVHGVAEGV
jgi:hypothetical protein